MCQNLKGIIESKYTDFDQPLFQYMKWFDPKLGTKSNKKQVK